jgi:hypothetical protein
MLVKRATLLPALKKQGDTPTSTNPKTRIKPLSRYAI